LSIYAKAGTSNFLQLWHGISVQTYANFNLSTGVVGTVGTDATAAITNAGNGWYRCSITFTPFSAGTIRIALVTSATAAYNESWTAAGTESIFIWGAQVELGSTASTYTRNNGGVYPPRFDYDPVTLAPKGILIEEQRTNLLLQSETFDNASWSKGNGTVTADAIASPDGTVDADAFIENTAASVFHFIAQSVAKAASNIQYTVSFYVKDKGRQVGFSFNSGASGVAGRVNPATGTVTAAIGVFGTGWTAGSLTMTNAGNGWYRVVIVATSDTATTAQFQLSLHNGTSATYTGDGVSGAYLWGAQMEAGAFATSYIPTVASTVTRTTDTTAIIAPNFAPWYNQSEGTLVVEASTFKPTTSTLVGVIADVNDGTLSNRSGIMYRSASAQGLSAVAATTVVDLTQAYTAGAVDKLAFAIKLNDYAFARNGALVGTDTTAGVPVVDRMGVGTFSAGVGPLNGHVRSVRYYPVRLSDAQLQALTA
jgi:hypothetical protein